VEWIIGGIKALTGFSDAITSVSNALANAKIAAIGATTEQERIAANERVATLQARRDTLIAEAGVSKANTYVRTFIALPIGILFWKIYVWDKAFGQWTAGHTDALDPNLWQVIQVVLGFYFLYEGAVGITKLIKQK